jgi:hypothetical protein
MVNPTYGYGFTSPYGLPRMGFYNGDRRTKPTVFRFSTQTHESRGTLVEKQKRTKDKDMDSIIYGNGDIERVHKEGYKLPFAYRYYVVEGGTRMIDYVWIDSTTEITDSVTVAEF